MRYLDPNGARRSLSLSSSVMGVVEVVSSSVGGAEKVGAVGAAGSTDTAVWPFSSIMAELWEYLCDALVEVENVRARVRCIMRPREGGRTWTADRPSFSLSSQLLLLSVRTDRRARRINPGGHLQGPGRVTTRMNRGMDISYHIISTSSSYQSSPSVYSWYCHPSSLTSRTTIQPDQSFHALLL